MLEYNQGGAKGESPGTLRLHESTTDLISMAGSIYLSISLLSYQLDLKLWLIQAFVPMLTGCVLSIADSCSIISQLCFFC